MIFPDYHLHTSFSSDSETDPISVVEKAISLGLDSICITDHYDMDFPIDPREPELTFDLDIDDYIMYLAKLRENYSDKLDIRLGIELGVMDSTCDKLNSFVNRNNNFDFIIASSHIVDGMDPYNEEYFYGKTDKIACERYFETILYNVKHFKDYNVYGHLDYILRYMRNKPVHFNLSDYYDIFDEILKVIVHDGKGIEINTGALYAGLPFPHPNKDILALYKKHGGEIITVGSDAHRTDKIAYGFDVAKNLLLECGFKYYCTFKDRKPTFLPIDQKK